MCVRLLGLGNDILADDAFGIEVARGARRVLSAGEVEIVESSASGLHLLDHVIGCSRLIVADTVETGRGGPGTLYVWDEAGAPAAAGDTPHCLGLFDALKLARALGLPAPEEVTIVAVEPADCFTIGGEMHPAVAAAIPRAVELVGMVVRRQEQKPEARS